MKAPAPVRAPLVHDCRLEWPNGKGYTPCTKAYADKAAERDAVYNPFGDTNLHDLSPEAYNTYCQLDYELGSLQLGGHLQKGVAY